MNTPTFSAISDLYSPTQLQRALVEADQINSAIIDCIATLSQPSPELWSACWRLHQSAKDAAAEYEASMKRTAPKVVSGG